MHYEASFFTGIFRLLMATSQADYASGRNERGHCKGGPHYFASSQKAHRIFLIFLCAKPQERFGTAAMVFEPEIVLSHRHF